MIFIFSSCIKNHWIVVLHLIFNSAEILRDHHSVTGKRKSSAKRKATQFQGTHKEVDTKNVHIATGEDMETSIELNVNTSEPEVMQEPHHGDHTGEDMSQDSNQSSRSSQIPQRRGPTKCVRFSSEINERLQIEFNEKGQPIGQNSIAYSTWLGVVAKDVGPITISTWHKMPSDLKEKMWKMVKKQREKLKKVKERDKLQHTCSRKGYARLENEMKRNNDNPSSITRGDAWRKVHLKKNGGKRKN